MHGETGVPGEKPLGAKERTNNKLIVEVIIIIKKKDQKKSLTSIQSQSQEVVNTKAD